MLLAALVALSGCLPRFQRAAVDTVGDLDALSPRVWTAIDLGGNTMSSDGSRYEIRISRGDPDNLLIYFSGGGAAWDAGSASHPLTVESLRRAQAEGTAPGYYTPAISRLAPLLMAGLLDTRDEANPFRDWTIVYIPYTTGDFHTGDNVVEYLTEAGAVQTMHFNGYNNAVAALDWTYGIVENPARVLVAGSSAGGFAAAIWFDRIAAHYPDSRLFLYSDSSYLHSENSYEVMANVWRTDLAGRFGFDMTDDIMAAALGHVLGKYGTRVTVLQSHTILDSVLPWFEAQLNGVAVEDAYWRGWSERMLATLADLHARYPNLYVYLSDYGMDDNGRTMHTLMTTEGFHGTAEEGISAVEWLADAVIGDEPVSVGLSWLDYWRD